MVETDDSSCGQMATCPYCGKNITIPYRRLKKPAIRPYSSGVNSQEPEKTILTTQPDFRILIPAFILLSLGTIVCLIIAGLDSKGLSGGVVPVIGVLGIFLTLGSMALLGLWFSSIKYVITNMRIVSESGIWLSSKTSVYIKDIRAIEVQRTWLPGVASIVIATAATSGAEIVLRCIPEWEKVETLLNSYRKGYQN